ncbi:hypothetical protein ACP4OV_011129 [Aristida adscensionis]
MSGSWRGDARPRRRRRTTTTMTTVLEMSLHEFLERFAQYAHVSPQVYVMAYAYLDRLRRGDTGVRVVRTNEQRLLTAAILIASKFVEDRNHKNSYFVTYTHRLQRMHIAYTWLELDI